MYEVRWSDVSRKQLDKVESTIAKRIVDKVESIVDSPFRFVKRLKGFDLYSLRVGNYRVIMSIEGNKMIIFVLEVGHRSSIYKKY